MKTIIVAAVAFAAGIGLAAPAHAQSLVQAQNPETIRALFETWGYRPTALRVVDNQPLFEATISGLQNAVVLGGCTNGRDCNHIVLLVTYDDVANPPFEWLNRQNFHYNLVTAMRREDGLLTLRTGIMLGREGIPVSAVRAAIEDWIAVNNDIARAAVDAGLARE